MSTKPVMGTTATGRPRNRSWPLRAEAGDRCGGILRCGRLVFGCHNSAHDGLLGFKGGISERQNSSARECAILTRTLTPWARIGFYVACLILRAACLLGILRDIASWAVRPSHLAETSSAATDLPAAIARR